MGMMKIIERSKVIVLDSDMIESEVMLDLMKDFPPISREDPPEVLAEYVAQHYMDTGEAMDWGQIPHKANAHLKVARNKRKQTDSDSDEEVEEKPKNKAKKAKAPKTIASNIQKEVANLELVKVLEKRTRGSSEAVSPPKNKKTHSQPKKTTRKLVMSKYSEET